MLAIDQLFLHLKRPDPGCFYPSKDPRDIRLADMISSEPEDFDCSQIVLLSCSQDQGVIRNNGRAGAAKGPEEIRKALYRLAAPDYLAPGDLFDLGDNAIGGSLEEIHQRQFEIVSTLLAQSKKVIVLGGGNDLSYPDCRAYRTVYPTGLTVNVDAHLDIRRSPVANSGTPYRQLIDEKIIRPGDLVEFGIQRQSNSKIYLADARKMGIQVHMIEEIQQKALADVLDRSLEELNSGHLFLGFDMDSICSADAPGVSAPSPVGFSAREAVSIVRRIISNHRVDLLEITEMNPLYDQDSKTARLASMLAYTYLEYCRLDSI